MSASGVGSEPGPRRGLNWPEILALSPAKVQLPYLGSGTNISTASSSEN